MIANANNIVRDQPFKPTEQQLQEMDKWSVEAHEVDHKEDLKYLFGDESAEEEKYEDDFEEEQAPLLGEKQPQEYSPYFGGSNLANSEDSEEEKFERRVRFEQEEEEEDVHLSSL